MSGPHAHGDGTPEPHATIEHDVEGPWGTAPDEAPLGAAVPEVDGASVEDPRSDVERERPLQRNEPPRWTRFFSLGSAGSNGESGPRGFTATPPWSARV